jgi:hypothetical protein
MRNQEKQQPANPAQSVYDEALRNWQGYGKGDERLITIRAIMTVTRLCLKPELEEEEITDVCWLLSAGEVLADMALYETPVAH